MTAAALTLLGAGAISGVGLWAVVMVCGIVSLWRDRDTARLRRRRRSRRLRREGVAT